MGGTSQWGCDVSCRDQTTIAADGSRDACLDNVLSNALYKESLAVRTVYTDTLQYGLTPFNRCLLVDWMVEVAVELQMQLETLHLAVDLLDRFFSIQAVEWGQHQLAGAACLWIASKYEEVCSECAKGFCYYTKNSFTVQQLVEMEAKVLSTVDYRLALPTTHTFLQLFLQLSQTEPSQELILLASYLSELSLLCQELIASLPSTKAAASLYVARCMLRLPQPWDAQLELCSGYTAHAARAAAIQLAYAHMRIQSDKRFNASRKHYLKPEQLSAASIPVCASLALRHEGTVQWLLQQLGLPDVQQQQLQQVLERQRQDQLQQDVQQRSLTTSMSSMSFDRDTDCLHESTVQMCSTKGVVCGYARADDDTSSVATADECNCCLCSKQHSLTDNASTTFNKYTSTNRINASVISSRSCEYNRC